MIKRKTVADTMQNQAGRNVRCASKIGLFGKINARFAKSRFLFPVNITAMGDFVLWTDVRIVAKRYG